ncbi:MAG: nickel-dependent lactate racemase [Desulfobacteraceae bacterium]|nr:MAG: nickel-dependent lactate racemase [Desulfobacteraceae bacterium]
MGLHVNYEGRRIEFTIPEGWRLISGEDRPPVPGVKDPLAEVRRALDNPIGSPRIEELVRPGMDVVLLFDDLQRPTPAHLVLPEILNRLNRAGIRDDRVKAVCALGTHHAYNLEELRTKVGEESYVRLEGRLFSHDPHARDNVIVGRTHRGILVELNKHVALADLVIGVGECMPHPTAGYGGGYKLIMPGVSSYRTVADHHFAWIRHRESRVNVREGNFFYHEIVDAGRLSSMRFKVDLVINEKKEIVRAFAGETEAQHDAACRFSESLYLVTLPKLPDVTITAAYPMEYGVQSTKALTMASYCTRAGGTIIWVAPQKQAGPIMPLIREMASPASAGEFHRMLSSGEIPEHLRPFGISYIMQVVFFKGYAEKFRVIHVTEGLSREQVEMMKYTYAPDIQSAIDLAARDLPKADVAVLPSGGTVIPEVRQG